MASELTPRPGKRKSSSLKKRVGRKAERYKHNAHQQKKRQVPPARTIEQTVTSSQQITQTSTPSKVTTVVSPDETEGTIGFLKRASNILSNTSRTNSLRKEKQHQRIINSYAYSQVEAASCTSISEHGVSVDTRQQLDERHEDQEVIDGARRFQIRQLLNEQPKQSVSFVNLSQKTSPDFTLCCTGC